MRAQIRRVAVVGEADRAAADALRESGWVVERVAPSPPWRLFRELIGLRPAVIHARAAHLSSALLGRALGVPVVLQAGVDDARPAVARAARFADRTVTGSVAVREALRALGAPADRVHVSRALLDLDRDVRGAAHAPASMDRRGAWVVSAAPLDGEDRGHDDLLLAFAALARSRPALRLLLAGTGPRWREVLLRVDRLGLAARVEARAVAPGQLASVFAHAAAMVGASRTGNYPDAVPEALAAGAPVVATAAGPHASWIREGRTGWLVPPRAPVSLAARLAQVLDNPEMAHRVGARARDAALELLAPRSVALELSRTYAAVARVPPLHRVALRVPEPALARAFQRA